MSYRETRESHSIVCECDHCIADRRYEENVKRYEATAAMAVENNRLLSSILDELREFKLLFQGRRR